MTAAKSMSKAREPLIHLTRRSDVPVWKVWLFRLVSFLCAMAFTALFVYLMIGISPAKLYATIFEGAFGTTGYLLPTVKTAAKLLCIAVALAPAFKMKFWNVGAEGQVLAGGMATALIMHDFTSLPTPVMFPLMIVFSILAGAVWGLIPAFFKAKFNTNETLFTLMMNYIAMKIVDHFYNTWRGSKSSLGMLNSDIRLGDNYEKGYLRSLWAGSSSKGWLTSEDFWFIAVILVIAVLMFFYLKSTKHGYEIAVVGESRNTARYAGINVNRVVIRTMILSGAICGLCGFLTVSSQSHTISSATAGGFGFTAIIVAWLSQFNTFAMCGVSLLVVALQNGTKHISDAYSNFSVSAADVVVGIFLLFIIASEFFINYRIVFRRKNDRKEVA